ncbi:MAG TPA: sensor histidine kinase [Savagea sp.]
MKAAQLFLKEHIPLIVFQLLLLIFILLLYWLDGFRNINTAIYALIMGMTLTAGYLLAKFILRRNYYTKIVNPPTKMEDLLIRQTTTPEHVQTSQFMRKGYQLYQGEVQRLYSSQHRQLHFINQWVHQMKTPISVMNLLVQEEQIDRLSVQEELDKIQRGLESVLVHARLETFEDDMRIERIPLRSFVQSIVNEHKRLFITNGVFPKNEIDEDMIVASDRKWLKIIVEQFITNAVKYTFEKGKSVTFLAEQKDNELYFTVADEGIGISSSDLNRIKKPFFTGENGRLTGESTGMGLYIVAEACEHLNHRFDITSTPGEGTKMTVIFKREMGGGTQNGETERHPIRRHHENLRK